MQALRSPKNKGALICAIGVICNLLLCAGKISVGFIFGSVSVTADGFNNLSDCGSGFVALVAFFIAAKPADKEHPYGHHRAEYVAAMITGFFVLLLAVGLLREAIETLIRHETPVLSWLIFLVLGVSIAVKFGMCALYGVYAKKLDSSTLKAAATDSFCDGFATLAVIIGAVVCPYLPSADGWAGIIVSFFIVWQGVKIIMEASSRLLGQAPEPALAERIRAMSLSAEGVLGVHDLQIYTYGKGVSFATIHTEMDASLSMLDAHTAIDALEAQVKKETGVILTVHIDPVDLTNREESALKLQVWEAARELAEGLELHDFRLIPGTNRVEFDVGVPYNCKRTNGELHNELVAIVKGLGDYEPAVNIERE